MNQINEKVEYCLNCKTQPCSNKGCPLGNKIPEFIKAIKVNEYKKAYQILSQTTVLPGICGKICPHMKQCQGNCVRGIKGNSVEIGEIESFIFEKMCEQKVKLKDVIKIKEQKKEKVAIIGAGPAGLTCAAFLAKEGVQVTIYEKYNYLGGILVHGIPEFRLPKKTINETINNIIDLGINVKYEEELGKNLSIYDLENKYDAIFISFGANIPSKMNIEGENLNGVYGGNELLERNNYPDLKNKTVSVIGGGNVAIDCARTVKKLGAKKVKVIYRRSEKEMPAEVKEIEEAKKEGIEFLYQHNIVKIIGDTAQVKELELIQTKLVKREGQDREFPINREGTNYNIQTDYVIMAVGSQPDKKIVDKLNLKTDKYGKIKIDKNYKTSNHKIYAGGDIAGIKSTVAWAAMSGREAAKNILNKLNNVHK